jgi:hypothetical protein
MTKCICAGCGNEHEIESKQDEPSKDRSFREARAAIVEDPLSVNVCSDWQRPGEALEAASYEILLSTGGPACRIVGHLRDGMPSSAEIEHQDWFTPWRAIDGDGFQLWRLSANGTPA